MSGRRASDARRLVAIGTISYLGSHGTELLRAGWTEPTLDPAVRDWGRRIQAFGREADTPELRRLRVRIEDKGSIVAFHWRGAPDEEAARAAIDAIAARAEQGGLRTHWGRKVLEVRPPVRMDKGAGIVAFLPTWTLDAAVYVGDDATDLDAFRGLGELRRRGPPQDTRCASASAPTKGRPSWRRRPTSSSTAPRACVRCWRPCSRPTSGWRRPDALHGLPQGDGDDERGGRDAAGGDHGRRRRARTTTRCSSRSPPAGGCSPRRRDARSAAARETSPPIARLLAGAQIDEGAARGAPEPRSCSTACGRCCCARSLAGGLALVFPQIAAIATGFAIIWALSWRRQDAAVTAIEERDGVRYYVERTSPLKPIQLLRTPGFKASTWQFEDASRRRRRAEGVSGRAAAGRRPTSTCSSSRCRRRPGWRGAEPALAARSSARARASRSRAAAPVREVRTFVLTDLVQARAARAAARAGIAAHRPRALIYASATAALLGPRPARSGSTRRRPRTVPAATASGSGRSSAAAWRARRCCCR